MTSDQYLKVLGKEFAGLLIIDKRSSRLSKVIDRALRAVTFGGQTSYMTHYVTTIHRTIYLPCNWAERSDADRYVTLRHEAVHLRQFRRYTLLGMTFLYLFPILPMGLAWGRARLEWEAYAETLRAVAEVHGRAAASESKLHAHIVRQFVGSAYGFMWPFPNMVQGWIERTVAELR